MVWGVGQLASGPLLTLTIIVINSDTQSSLFTGSGRRERRDKLVYWRGPFSQGAVVHHLGWWGWWDAVCAVCLCVCWGLGALQLKTHHDLVTGGSYKGQNLNREKRREECEAELKQSSASGVNDFHTFSHPDGSIRVILEQQHEINTLDNKIIYIAHAGTKSQLSHWTVQTILKLLVWSDQANLKIT